MKRERKTEKQPLIMLLKWAEGLELSLQVFLISLLFLSKSLFCSCCICEARIKLFCQSHSFIIEHSFLFWLLTRFYCSSSSASFSGLHTRPQSNWKLLTGFFTLSVFKSSLYLNDKTLGLYSIMFRSFWALMLMSLMHNLQLEFPKLQ